MARRPQHHLQRPQPRFPHGEAATTLPYCETQPMSSDGAASHHGTGRSLLLWHRHQLPSGQELEIKIPIPAQFGAGRGGGGGGGGDWASQRPTGLAKQRGGKGSPGQAAATSRCGLLLRLASCQAAAGCEDSETREERARVHPPPGQPSPSRPVPSRRGGRASPTPALRPRLLPAAGAALRMRGRPLARARFQPLGCISRSGP